MPEQNSSEYLTAEDQEEIRKETIIKSANAQTAQEIQQMISDDGLDESNYVVIKQAQGQLFNKPYRSYDKVVRPQLIQLSHSQKWDLFLNSPMLFSTINRIVEDVTSVDTRFIPRNPAAKVTPALQKRINSVNAFFARPNSVKESWKVLRQKHLTDKLVVGWGVYEKILSKNTSGKLQELRALPAGTVFKSVDVRGNFISPKKAYYQQIQSDDPIPFSKDQIIYSIDTPVSHMVNGLCRLDVICNIVAADILSDVYNSNILVNSSTPPGILSVDGMKKDQLKSFTKMWTSKLKGPDNAGKIAVVNVPVQWIRTVLTADDMQLGEYAKILREKIWMIYGLQPMIQGVVDQSTGRLNSEQQVQLYKNNALKPLLKSEEYDITEEIIADGLGISDVKADFSGVDLLDMKNQAEVDTKYVINGILKPNEVRSRLGLQPIPQGENLRTMPGEKPNESNDKKPKPKPEEDEIEESISNSNMYKELGRKVLRYRESTLLKLESYFSNKCFMRLADYMKSYEKFEKRAHSKNIGVFSVDIYKLPAQIKKMNEVKILDVMLDYSYVGIKGYSNMVEDTFRAIQNKIKFEVIYGAKYGYSYQHLAMKIKEIFEKPITVMPKYEKSAAGWIKQVADIEQIGKG